MTLQVLARFEIHLINTLTLGGMELFAPIAHYEWICGRFPPPGLIFLKILLFFGVVARKLQCYCESFIERCVPDVIWMLLQLSQNLLLLFDFFFREIPYLFSRSTALGNMNNVIFIQKKFLENINHFVRGCIRK